MYDYVTELKTHDVERRSKIILKLLNDTKLTTKELAEILLLATAPSFKEANFSHSLNLLNQKEVKVKNENYV